MRKWVFAVALVAALGLVAVLLAPGRELTRSDAERIAAERIAEYSTTEGIDVSRFTLTEVRSEEKYPWIFEYKSSGTPSHLVTISITRRGAVEMARMIE